MEMFRVKIISIQNTRKSVFLWIEDGLTGEETWSFHDGKSGIVGHNYCGNARGI